MDFAVTNKLSAKALPDSSSPFAFVFCESKNKILVLAMLMGIAGFLIAGWQIKCCHLCHDAAISFRASSRRSIRGETDTGPISSHLATASIGRITRASSSVRKSQSSGITTTVNCDMIREDEGNLRNFIYVYDLPGSSYLDDILDLDPPWHSIQYDAEKVLTELVVSSNLYRTEDPSKASLFFVPFYSARYTLYHYDDSRVNMREAVEKTSEVWESILGKIRAEYPFFNRYNGRDHFGILTMDHGRCTALTFVKPSLYGEMFFLQLNGDKFVRSGHTNGNRNMQSITYNYELPVNSSLPDIPCFLPDRDIVIPPLVRVAAVPSHREQHRPIKVLFRFSPGQHHGVPIPHHGHEIRRELYQLFEAEKNDGWEIGARSEAETNDEWVRAVFCVCPPGHSQWTSRPFKSILSGCIPITFFREHENPWQDELNYEVFSINIDPDRLVDLKQVVETLASVPGAIESFQTQILNVKESFEWTGSFEGGVGRMVLRRLQKRSRKLRHLQNTRLQGYEYLLARSLS